MVRLRARGALLAIGAACLFGGVTVAAKGSGVPALALAALAFLVSGAALTPWLGGLRLDASDRRRAAAMAIFGGALAPWLVFRGLELTTAVDASLLLTLEMAFTAALAAIFLHERHSPRVFAGLALLFGAGALVAVSAAGDASDRRSLLGGALVGLAALAWAVDNTVSASLATRHDARALVALKSLLGGGATLGVLLATDGLPALDARQGATILLVGALGLAVGTVVFYGALRDLGATRTTGLFIPVSALAGSAGGLLVHGEPLGWPHAAAAALAAAGVLLVVRAE